MDITEVRFTARLPKWAADYLDQEASENFTSRNAEILRSIRERRTATTGEGLGNSHPVAAGNRQGVEAPCLHQTGK